MNNRIENYIKKLETWSIVCNKIVRDSNDLEVKFRARELLDDINDDLIYYKNELNEFND